MSTKKAFVLFLSTIFILLAESHLLADDFLVEKDLKLDWVFLDERQEIMLPYLDNSNRNPVAIHLFLEEEFGNQAYLKLEIPAEVSLFIDGKFIFYNDSSTVNHYSLDSIKQKLDLNNIHLTLYKKERFDGPVEAKIGYMHRTFTSSVRVNPIQDRSTDRSVDFLKLVILLIVGFFTILYTLFRSDLFEFLSIRSLITFRYTETGFLKYRTLTKTQILVIVYQAALMSSILVIYLHYFNNPFGNVFFIRTNMFVGWLLVFLLLLVAIFFKYVLISIVSTLFKVADRINFYFIEYLRMSMIFYSLIFLVLSFMVINHFYLLDNLFQKLVIAILIFNFVRFLILYFKFRGTVTMKNLHLFSYLCTTELIPMVLGLNFFLK